MKSYEDVKKYVKSILSEKRFYHSQCVEERCVELAKIYGVSEEKARLVGIAHDIAKEMSTEEKKKFIEENNINIDEVEEKNIGLMHAKIGAQICKSRFDFSEDMQNAISNHTTGKAGMDTLSKIVFISDATSKDRKYDDVEYLHQLSLNNLDQAVLECLNKTIEICLQEEKSIHLDTIKARNEYYKK